MSNTLLQSAKNYNISPDYWDYMEKLNKTVHAFEQLLDDPTAGIEKVEPRYSDTVKLAFILEGISKIDDIEISGDIVRQNIDSIDDIEEMVHEGWLEPVMNPWEEFLDGMFDGGGIIRIVPNVIGHDNINDYKNELKQCKNWLHSNHLSSEFYQEDVRRSYILHINHIMDLIDLSQTVHQFEKEEFDKHKLTLTPNGMKKKAAKRPLTN